MKKFVNKKGDTLAFCKSCGARNNVGARFCQNCGTLLNLDDKEIKKDTQHIFCKNCGSKNNIGARFCQNCGILLDDESNLGQTERPEQGEQYQQSVYSERRQEFAGKIIKCPNCGEILESFLTACPFCGYEIRGTVNSTSIQEFAIKLERETSRQGKITIIRNFPIPNTKEDVFEFLILAASNVSSNLDNDISNAWQSKAEQAYQKAKLLFRNRDEFTYIQSIYNQVMEKLDKARKAKNMKRANLLMSEMISFLPNVIIVVG